MKVEASQSVAEIEMAPCNSVVVEHEMCQLGKAAQIQCSQAGNIVVVQPQLLGCAGDRVPTVCARGSSSTTRQIG